MSGIQFDQCCRDHTNGRDVLQHVIGFNSVKGMRRLYDQKIFWHFLLHSGIMTRNMSLAVKYMNKKKTYTGSQFFCLNILLVVIMSFLFLPSARALNIPNLQGYVNDYADMITPSVKSELENKLRAFEQEDSTQIVILTIPSLEGEMIEKFSLKVANTWKLGQRGKDNGILFLVSKQDRKMRIEIGRGLEKKLPNAIAGRIINEIIKPKFAVGDFDGGFIAGASALIGATKGAYTAKKR